MSLLKRYKERYDIAGLLFLAPALIWLFLVIVYPVITIVPASFKEYVASSRSFQFVGLEQYRRLLSDPLLWLSMRVTLVYAGLTTAFHLVVGWAMALLLNTRRLRGRIRPYIRALLLLPWVFSAPAAAILWSILYNPRGFFSYYIQQIFHQRILFLSEAKTALFAVLAVGAWNHYALYMLLLFGGLQAIPDSVHEAAKIDGANRFQSFFHVTLPLMSSLMMMVIIIDFVTTFVNFELIFILTRGGPMRVTYVIAYFLYERGLQTYRWGYASALSVFLAAIISVFVFVYLYLYSRRRRAIA